MILLGNHLWEVLVVVEGVSDVVKAESLLEKGATGSEKVVKM